MEKFDSPKGTEQEDFRYSNIPRPRSTNALNMYLLVSLVKGIVWLIKTPVKWVIKKMK